MTYTGERDAAFTRRVVKIHIRSRRNKEMCEVPQRSRKGTRVYPKYVGVPRSVSHFEDQNGFHQRKRSTTHRSFPHNFLQCYQIAVVLVVVREVNPNFACPKVIPAALVSSVCIIFTATGYTSKVMRRRDSFETEYFSL